MTKKGYQKRLPTVLVPAPRPAPEVESASPDTTPTPEPAPASGPPPEPVPAAAPTPSPPARAGADDRSRPFRVGALVVAGLLLVGGLAAALPRLLEDDTPTSTLLAGPGGGVDPATTEESYAEASVARDGTIAVRHWIRSDEPVQRLSLALPDVPQGVTLTATDVQVLADDEPAAGPARVDGRAVTYRFPPATSVQLSYVLVGAVTVSDRETGRALALATTLDLRYPHRSDSETRVIRADEVLALACTPSSDVAPVPCGTVDGENEGGGDGWRVELSGAAIDDRVVAQLTLD